MVALSQNSWVESGRALWSGLYSVKSHNHKLADTTWQQVRWWGHACQLTGNDDLNRTVLSSRRKTVSEGALRIEGGTEFQALAAATGNAGSPSDERRLWLHSTDTDETAVNVYSWCTQSSVVSYQSCVSDVMSIVGSWTEPCMTESGTEAKSTVEVSSHTRTAPSTTVRTLAVITYNVTHSYRLLLKGTCSRFV